MFAYYTKVYFLYKCRTINIMNNEQKEIKAQIEEIKRKMALFIELSE